MQACEVFRCLQIRNMRSNQPISVQCSISYRKQSFDLLWFLYEMQHWAEVGLSSYDESLNIFNC